MILMVTQKYALDICGGTLLKNSWKYGEITEERENKVEHQVDVVFFSPGQTHFYSTVGLLFLFYV